MPSSTKPAPYYCAIVQVTPNASSWESFEDIFNTAKILDSLFYGCLIFPYWKLPRNDHCGRKILRDKRLVIFPVINPLPPLAAGGVVIVREEDLGGVASRLAKGEPLENFRRYDVRLAATQNKAT